MKMTIRPNQITTDYDHGYLNMMTVGAGGIGVWTSVYAQPTYLLRQDKTIHFVTFASQMWADEWLEENEQKYEVVWKFEPEAEEVIE